MTVLNIAFYKFVPIDDVEPLAEKLKAFCVTNELKGSVLLGHEGINGMVAGSTTNVRVFESFLQADPRFTDIIFKETESEKVPFRRFVVRQKEEIVPIGIPDMNPLHIEAPYMPPKELKARLDAGEDIVLLDTRNTFEYELGTFVGAKEIGVRHFRSFAGKVDSLPDEWKKKTIVTFCTGGIRCEKAAPYMRTKGFENTYQLEGGILNYFAEVGGDHWTGDCFVFDYRLAVDSNLKPANTVQCIHCRNPITGKSTNCPSCGA